MTPQEHAVTDEDTASWSDTESDDGQYQAEGDPAPDQPPSFEIIFRQIDDDGDGRVSRDELLDHMLSRGVDPDRADGFFRELDSWQGCRDGAVVLTDFEAGFDAYTRLISQVQTTLAPPVLVHTDGTQLYACGTGPHLGLGSEGTIPVLELARLDVLQDRNIAKFACSEKHVLAVGSNGTVYSWGSNECGQLGQGNFETLLVPTKMLLLQDEYIVDVGVGDRYSCLLSGGGDLFSCGYGGGGALGRGDYR